MNQSEHFDWLWMVVMPLVFVIVFIIIPLLLSRLCQVSFTDAVFGTVALIFVVGIVVLLFNVDNISERRLERVGEELKREHEIAKQTTPFYEREIDAIRLLSKEQQEKDKVENEIYLFTSIEEELETAYVEIVFHDKLDQTIYRFPAYVQYADVDKAKMRYQLIGNTVYNAVVTLPTEAGESLE